MTCVLVREGYSDADIHREDGGEGEKTAICKLENARLVPKRRGDKCFLGASEAPGFQHLDLGHVWPLMAVIQDPYLQNMCMFVCMCMMCVSVSTCMH